MSGIARAVARMRARPDGCRQYAHECIGRLHAAADLNTVVHCDEQGWLDEACQADRSDAALPLRGVPLFVKDSIFTRELPTSSATPALAGFVAGVDAPVVANLVAAGAYVAAKTNMHELGYGITSNNAATGAVRNPADPAMIAGGSSGGSAAAVAAGIVPAALGSDMGGSLRIPPALCGVCGYRPSVGRYRSALAIASTCVTAGPIAATVADCILLDAAMRRQQPPPLALPALAGMRIGIPREHFWENLDGELAAVAEAALPALAAAGVQLVEADIPGVGELAEAISTPIARFETLRNTRQYLSISGCGVGFDELVAEIRSPDVKAVYESLGTDPTSPAEYRQALEVGRPRLQQAYRACFARHRLAALCYPTTPLPARPIGQDETVEINGSRQPTLFAYVRNTHVGSNADLPSFSLPAGCTADGLPVGMMLESAAGSDDSLLAIAAAIEPVFAALL
ncbi:MAG: amidase family protein [Betaproteobacteria bacterium]|nr:amidase family protein [Betaproteobacteria bacterium]